MSALKKPHRVLLMMRPPVKLRADYLVLALLFLVGVIGGHIVGGAVSDAQHQELSDYLSAYLQNAVSRQSIPLAGVLFSYFRAPIALVLMGLSGCGIWMVPLFLVGQGFFLAFSVHTFAGALGRGGVLFSFAAFGIRCFFVLPCCFLLASQSWASAYRLHRREHLRGREEIAHTALYPVIVCGIVLLIGCVIEISLVPRLFLQILSHISP